MNKTSKINYPDELPITAHREEIIEAIGNNNVVIISGDTGSGKTTQLPKMCLEAGRGQKKIIGCTQPRRIAAITVASRVQEELGVQFEDIVGHKIRFQDKTTRNTKIKFMTDGILLAETRSDHGLYAYDTLIIDEAHERSLNIDFLLGYAKQLLLKRKGLKKALKSLLPQLLLIPRSLQPTSIRHLSLRFQVEHTRWRFAIDRRKKAATKRKTIHMLTWLFRKFSLCTTKGRVATFSSSCRLKGISTRPLKFSTRN